MEISRITYDDLTELGKLQPEGWQDIVPEFSFYLRRDYCIAMKAVIEQNLVGVGALIVFGHTAWLAHIIVAQHFRNRGFGYQITERLIEDGKKRSVKTFLLIATELGFPVYQKVGFSPVTEYPFFTRDVPWKDTSLSQDIISCHDQYEAEIFRLDREITGEDRSSLLGGYLANTILCRKDDEVSGFYMPDLGEGLILAKHPEAGMELMKVKYATVEKAVLPSENRTGIEYLLQNGFTSSGIKGTRMILGGKIAWKPDQVYSRIGGNYG
jgi:GNAT superfamily N-acetyltransferase